MCFSTQKKPFFREREQDPKKIIKKKIIFLEII
jgi:hypothetical protein